MSRILVTNDDGVASPGLGILAVQLAAAGHDVFIAAPSMEASGSAAAIGAILEGDEIVARAMELPEAPKLTTYAVDGPPGRAVLAAILRAFGAPPDIVVSGINPGANTGRFLQLHSGTLGAALTAGNLGRTAMAVSIGSLKPTHWDTAAQVAVQLLPYLIACKPATVLNVNVPDVSFELLKGFRLPQVSSVPAKRMSIEGDVSGRMSFSWSDIAGQTLAEGSDTALIGAGYVTLTKVLGPSSITPEPLPAHLNDAYR